MSCCLKAGFSVSGSSNIIINHGGKEPFRVCSSVGALQFKESNLKEFWGKTLDVSDQKGVSNLSIRAPKLDPAYAQASVVFGKALRWWEKSLQPNMIEINSAQELVDYFLNAGDKLVIVDFYSPGCGGCKALHPKIKKFKDALAKHGTERCSLGPAKGLDESELVAIASIGQISKDLVTKEEKLEDLLHKKTAKSKEGNAMVIA